MTQPVEIAMDCDENGSPPKSASRKRKSEDRLEGTPSNRKALAEVNRSALPAPGWTKGSTSKPKRAATSTGKKSTSSKGRASQQECLIETPKETVEDMVEKCFGTADERENLKTALLKRAKPEQKLYGYAKKFLDSETKRLASGLKDSFTSRDSFIDACKDYERTMLSAIESAKYKLDQVAGSATDAKAKLFERENELKELRQQHSAIQNELNSLKSEFSNSKEREQALQTRIAQIETKKENVEEQVNIAKMELNEKEIQIQHLRERLENHAKELDEFKKNHEQELQKLRAANEEAMRDVPLLTARTESLQRDIELSQKEKNDAMQKVQATETELQRAQIANEGLKQQMSNMEAQVLQRDNHLNKTLETFQQNQTFSQDRIANLSDEKSKLEIRLTEITTVKGTLEVEKTRLEGSLKEATDLNTNLKTKLEQDMARVENLENELANIKVETSRAVENLEKSKREAASTLVQLEKLKKELKEEKEARTQEATELKSEREILGQKVKELSEANVSLESEVQALKTTYSDQGISADKRLEKLCEVSKEAEMLKKQVTDFDLLQRRLRETEEKLKETEKKLFDSDKARRRLHNEVQSLRGKVRVVARVRPLLPKPNKDSDCDSDVEMEGPKEAPIFCGVDGAGIEVRKEHEQSSGTQTRTHSFEFDRVFAQHSNQENVFEEVSEFVQSALDGYNVCLFSYGQTGSGKTYTMTGNHTSDTERGIIPRAIDQIMSYQTELRSKGWEYTLEATYVEIYNEAIRDLLEKSSKDSSKPEIRDSKKEIILKNVNRAAISCKDEINQILALAQRNRSVASTDCNRHSSRSHSVFTLYVKGVHNEFKAQVTGSLSMCDLAGSERISRSNATGERLKEAQAINKSLSSLATVFSSLNKKSSHVPYRNSKLTHLLQPCFAGEGKTMMIVNLSPELQDCNESLCSLRFAGQVHDTELGQAKKQISNLNS